MHSVTCRKFVVSLVLVWCDSGAFPDKCLRATILFSCVSFTILTRLMNASYMSKQVAVSTKRTATSQIPNYPNLSSQLMCQVQNITLHVCVLAGYICFCCVYMNIANNCYLALHVLIG